MLVARTSDFASLAEAAAHQYNASFCLCPGGDAPSFTQRLYVSILHGCIPVRIDTYLRYPPDPEGVETAYPFPNIIDWNRMSITISANGGNATKESHAKSGWRYLKEQFLQIVPRLVALEASGEAAAMRAYMRHVAPLLAFDTHSKTSGQLHRQDAASAALHELAIKLGKPIPWGGGGHRAAHNRSAGSGAHLRSADSGGAFSEFEASKDECAESCAWHHSCKSYTFRPNRKGGAAGECSLHATTQGKSSGGAGSSGGATAGGGLRARGGHGGGGFGRLELSMSGGGRGRASGGGTAPG